VKTTDVTCLALSADGTMLVTGHGNRSVLLWDVAKKTVRATLTGHTGAVRAVLCSPDGRTIVSGDEDGTGRLWGAVTGEELLAWKGEAAVTALAFSADGTMLAAGGNDGRVRLWYAPNEAATAAKSAR